MANKCTHYTPAEDSSVWSSMHRRYGCPAEGAEWPYNKYLEDEMAKVAMRHGDPQHYPEDMDKLKVRIRQLEEENKELLRALEDATARTVDRDNWRMRGW